MTASRSSSTGTCLAAGRVLESVLFPREVNTDLAHSRSALKRVRQNQLRRERNRATVSAVRTAIRRFKDAAAGQDLEVADRAFRRATKLIDQAAARGYLHKNAAARRKSRLSVTLANRQGPK